MKITFLKRNFIFKRNYAGPFDVSRGTLSNVVVFCSSLVLRNKDNITVLAGDQSWLFFITLLYLITETLCLVTLRVWLNK